MINHINQWMKRGRDFLILLIIALPALAQGSSETGPQQTLEPLLKIEWETGPNLPQGFQDSDGGVLDGSLITVGGFCSGGLEKDNEEKPGKYPRGFLKKGWILNLSEQDRGWKQLPDLPGAARQGLSCAKVGEALYFWGGFSYTEPYCYADGWRLLKREGDWVWEELPSLPWPVTTIAMSTIGSKIYAFGGADYNAEAFFTETDRSGDLKRLGARLLVLDTEDLEGGWRELSECPGTPRWVHAMANIDGSLYVIGGASGNVVIDGTSFGYCTIVDNWRYDTETDQWMRLRDLPVSSGNFPRGTNLVFEDRYILLPGGHQYTYVLRPDGTVDDKYGSASQARPESGLHNDCFVYDTQTELFGTADPLPIDNNLPMTVVHGDDVFLLGGETGGGVVDGEYYGHHPDLFLRGRIQKANSENLQ